MHSILLYPTVIFSDILQYIAHAILLTCEMLAISLLHGPNFTIIIILKFCPTLASLHVP